MTRPASSTAWTRFSRSSSLASVVLTRLVARNASVRASSACSDCLSGVMSVSTPSQVTVPSGARCTLAVLRTQTMAPSGRAMRNSMPKGASFSAERRIASVTAGRSSGTTRLRVSSPSGTRSAISSAVVPSSAATPGLM